MAHLLYLIRLEVKINYAFIGLSLVTIVLFLIWFSAKEGGAKLSKVVMNRLKITTLVLSIVAGLILPIGSTYISAMKEKPASELETALIYDSLKRTNPPQAKLFLTLAANGLIKTYGEMGRIMTIITTEPEKAEKMMDICNINRE